MKNLCLLLLLSLVFLSCEKDRTGLVDPGLTVPHLLTAALSTGAVDIDTDTTGTVTKTGPDTYEIRLQLSGAFMPDAASPSSVVRIRVRTAYSDQAIQGYDLAFTGRPGDTTAFHQALTFTIRRADAGNIRIAVRVVSDRGETSNAEELALQVTRRNSRPRVLDVSLPDTVHKPTDASVILVTFQEAVADSDGYNDIKAAWFEITSPFHSAPIPLYDDGNLQIHGDRAAFDGIFSRVLSVDSTNSTGTRTLVFLASDQSGAVSDSVFHTFVIAP